MKYDAKFCTFDNFSIFKLMFSYILITEALVNFKKLLDKAWGWTSHLSDRAIITGNDDLDDFETYVSPLTGYNWRELQLRYFQVKMDAMCKCCCLTMIIVWLKPEF